MSTPTKLQPAEGEWIDWRNMPFNAEAVKYRKVDAHGLEGMAASIDEQGIITKMPYAKNSETGQYECFDGQNRRDAAKLCGYILSEKDYELVPWPKDPAKFVRALNNHRRHLDKDDREKLIKDKLRTDPNISNPALAKMFGADPKTCKKYREEVEQELPNFLAIWDELPEPIQAAFTAERRAKLVALLSAARTK
jgi:hypothetical protein